jgi:hypothetical protein
MDKKFKEYKEDTKRRGWYDTDNTITKATANSPNDYNSAVYDVHKITNEIGIISPRIRVINDSTQQTTGTLYIVVSHSGGAEGTHETPVYSTDNFKDYYDVYELKVRCPTKDVKYRVSEYEMEKL